MCVHVQFVTAAIAAATADCWLFTDAKIYTAEPEPRAEFMYTCMRVEAKVGTKQSTEEDSYIRSKHIAYALLGLCAYPCVCVYIPT